MKQQFSTAEIVNSIRIPNEIVILFLDIDGTITTEDQVDKVIFHQILSIAGKGIFIVFITGRDRIWLEEFLVKPIEDENPSDEILEKLHFYSELGVCELDSVSKAPLIYPGVRDYSLVQDVSLRRRIGHLFLKTSDLEKIEDEQERRPGFYAVRDANQARYFYPVRLQELNTDTVFYDFILSDSKEIICTAEVLRDDRSRVPAIRRKQLDSAAKTLKLIFEYWGIDGKLSVVPTATAIDITPKVDGTILDKSWAAGRALKKISEQTGEDTIALASKSVAIGDGESDFKFSQPMNLLGNHRDKLNVPFIFVGGEEIPQSVTPEEFDSIIIKPAQGHKGLEVTKEAMRLLGLWDNI